MIADIPDVSGFFGSGPQPDSCAAVMPVSRLAQKDWSKLLSREPGMEVQCEREPRRYFEARAFVQFTGILFTGRD
jgi:hypothetical protein